MLNLRRFLLIVCIIHLPATVWAGSVGRALSESDEGVDKSVRRNYLNTSKHLISSHALTLIGSPRQIIRLSRWLDEIQQIPIGRETLRTILDSGHQLTIRHSEWALHASGRTLAPVSDNLTNGTGSDVEILFDVRIPERGSHSVFDAQRNAIEFTAVQNLFHELAHAKHLVSGTWRYFDSEGQAIEEENIFRRQFSEANGGTNAPLRVAVDGQQIWWPDN